jgi:hypothetical protein
MTVKKAKQRKSLNERIDPQDLNEDQILKEYRDVFDAVIDMDQCNSRIFFNFANTNQSIDCVVDIDARADRLTKENQDTFFDYIYSNPDDMYYSDFIETVNEMVEEVVPELEFSIKKKLTGFEGRSGGHFQIHVRMPESFVEVKRYVDGYVSYDLWDVNYALVMEFVEAIDKLVAWINQFIVDYWNGLCEDIRANVVNE